jgi:hypothetical protein
MATMASTAGASTAPAITAPSPTTVVAEQTGSRPVQQITVQQYLAAAAAGVAVAAVTAGTGPTAMSTSCYSYWSWSQGTNNAGAVVWQFNLEPYWCRNGTVISSAFTDVWGNTYASGWNYDGEIEAGTEYGVGWNEYYTYSQGKFCNAGCTQEGEPFLEVWAYANGPAYT